MLTIEAPSDAQLRYITGLCEERGLVPPAVVASKQEASEIIRAILERSYDPSRYVYPFGDGEDVPF
jgi:hypothetical protein